MPSSEKRVGGTGWDAVQRSDGTWNITFDPGGHGSSEISINVTSDEMAQIVEDPKKNFLRIVRNYM